MLALSKIVRQHYLLAATNSGIAYTTKSIYSGSGTMNDLANGISFTPFASFPQIKVTDIEIDSRPLINPDNNVPDYESLCDNVIWAATENGIYQISSSLEQSDFKDITIGMSFNSASSNNNTMSPVFERCDNTQPVIGYLGTGPIGAKIKWFKDSQYIPAWDDKSNVTFTDAGSYQAEITTLCEGITFKSITVVVKYNTPPAMTFNHPDNITLCENSTVQLSTASFTGYTYRWRKDNVIINGGISNTYNVIQPGKYSVEVSNCAGSFLSSKTVTVSYETFPGIEIISQKKNYCTGGEATLSTSAPPGYSIKWMLNGNEISQNADNQTLLTKAPGKYTVRLTSPVGCSKLSSPFDLIFDPLPAFAIKRSKLKTICFGETVTLSTDVTGASYLWSTGETTPSIIVSKAGSYIVEMTNAAGCKNTQTIDIEIAPILEIPVIADTVVCTIAQEKVRLFAEPGLVSYSWNGTISSNNYFDVTKPGNYNLIVTDINGCTANTAFVVEPYCKEIIINNTFTPNGDGLNDIWEIGGLENDQAAKLVIYNRFGNIVFQSKGPDFKWDGRMNNSDLPLGTYYYYLYAREGASVFKGSVTILR